jgi:predicted HAD superfamily phosphohydrolase
MANTTGKKFGGRTMGVLNKTTSENKDRMQFVLSKLDETIVDDINTLKPYERVKIWCSLIEYMHPKLSRVAVDTTEINIIQDVDPFRKIRENAGICISE